MADPTSILRTIRDLDDNAELEISVNLRLTVDAFRRAIEYGRLKQWTHERDGEWPDLIFHAITDGAGIEYDVEDAELVAGPAEVFRAAH